MALDSMAVSASTAMELCMTNYVPSLAPSATVTALGVSSVHAPAMSGLPMFEQFCNGSIKTQDCYYNADVQFANLIPASYDLTVATVVVNITNYPNTTITHTATITKDATQISAELGFLAVPSIPSATYTADIGASIATPSDTSIPDAVPMAQFGAAMPTAQFGAAVPIPVETRGAALEVPAAAARVTGFEVWAKQLCNDGRFKIITCAVRPAQTQAAILVPGLTAVSQLNPTGPAGDIRPSALSEVQSDFGSIAPPLASCTALALTYSEPSATVHSITATVTNTYFSMGYPAKSTNDPSYIIVPAKTPTRSGSNPSSSDGVFIADGGDGQSYNPMSSHTEDPVASIQGVDDIDIGPHGSDVGIQQQGSTSDSGSFVLCGPSNNYCGAKKQPQATATIPLPGTSTAVTYVPGAGVISIGDTTVTVNGPAATIGDATISLSPTGLVVNSASTIALPTQGPAIDAPVVVGGQTYTYHASSNVIQMGGVALSSNGPLVTLNNGQAVSWGSNGVVVVGSSTIVPIQNAVSYNADQYGAVAPFATYSGVFNAVGQLYTYHPGDTKVAIGTATLVAGGTPIMIDGSIYSLGPSGVIALAPTDLPSYAAVITLGAHTYTVYQNEKTLHLGSATITAGGAATTVEGVPVSLAPNSIVVGTQTIPLVNTGISSRTRMSLATASPTGPTSIRAMTTSTAHPAEYIGAPNAGATMSAKNAITQGLVIGIIATLVGLSRVV